MGKFLVAFAFAALLVSLTSAQSPEALLSKVFEAYQSLSGLRVRSTTVVELNIVAELKVGKGLKKQALKKLTFNCEATYQRPNLLRVRWIEEGVRGGTTIVSDGKSLFTQVDALRQVKKETSPKTLKEIVRSGNRQIPVVGGGLSYFIFIDERWKGKVAAVKVVGKETLNKRATTKIKLTYKDRNGCAQTLWVDEKGFIWQSQMRFEQSILVFGIMPVGKITITLTETFSEVTANPKLPKDFFAYKIPPGFKQVTEFQTSQMPPKRR